MLKSPCLITSLRHSFHVSVCQHFLIACDGSMMPSQVNFDDVRSVTFAVTAAAGSLVGSPDKMEPPFFRGSCADLSYLRC
ncbi:hypothetical protein BDR05DRAFT_437933 [Suillus weaverae]|nr:hypothetical protein BDR05DRAFT_437933 [Suillus weaverae]